MADEQPQILLNVQYIKDLSFEVPNAPAIYVQQDAKPQIAVNVDIDAERLEGEVFQVVLKLEVDAKANDDQVFLVELAYGAVATLKNIPDEQAQPALLIEVPRLIFPVCASRHCRYHTRRRVPAAAARSDRLHAALSAEPAGCSGFYRRAAQLTGEGRNRI